MNYWRTCSSCKKEISFSTQYYECSVSTCQGTRTGYVFCSLHCFERHLPGAKHRSAGAIEKKAPTQEAHTATLNSHGNTPSTIHKIPTPIPAKSSSSDDDVLIVVSKMKNYIREKSEMNTSGDVAEILSHFIRRLCDDAIHEARQDGRKTVMAKDFTSSFKSLK